MTKTSHDMTEFRAMTTGSTADEFGTKVYNASFKSIKRLTDRYAFMRPEQKYDLVSEVMRKACVVRSGFDPSKSSVETWVNAIAWRTVADWLDRWRSHEAVTVSYDETSDIDGDDAYGTSYGEDWRCFRSSPGLYECWYADRELERSERKEEMEAALGRLSESDRELAGMLADGIGTDEITERLGICGNALYGRVNKMRRRLREKLGTAA